jgi:hypothetical protein
MAYIGANPTTSDLTRTAAIPRDAERFSGNGSTTNFTLSRTLYGPTDADVVVENVYQEPIVSYNIVGNQLIFTEAPPAGTQNIYVVYRAVQGAQVTLPDGSVSYNKLANNIRLFTVDNYIANSSISTYALSEAPADANTLAVSIDGIVQRAPINYTTTANTITFTSAPPTGANVHIKHLGFRSSSVVTAIPAGTTITQPILSNPTITLAAEGSSFKGNVALYDSSGSSQVGRFGATSTGQVQLDVGANTLSVRSSTIALSNVTAFSIANTSGALGVSVDAAGRVTKPQQASFRAVTTGGTFPTSGSGSIINFNSVAHNIGGYFSTSGANAYKRFTAPVAGQYLFTFSLMSNVDTGRYYFCLLVNGGNYAQAGGTSTHYGNFSGSAVVQLATNDYVEVQLLSGTLYATSVPENYFTGYFLG